MIFSKYTSCETGVSDCHHVITTFLTSHLVRYKTFNENNLFKDAKNANFVCDIITRKVGRKELLQEMGEIDWLRKHVLQIFVTPLHC